MMNEYGKSDNSIVPKKLPNNTRERVAEAMEGRGLAKGNSLKRNALRTQGRIRAQSALKRIRQAAAFWRYYLRQEPYEVVPHVRICAGGAGRPAFLP